MPYDCREGEDDFGENKGVVMGDGRPVAIRDMDTRDLERMLSKCGCSREPHGCDTCYLAQQEREQRQAKGEAMGDAFRDRKLVPAPVEQPEESLRALLRTLGANEEAVANTPTRFLKALNEMTSGRSESPEEILSKQFEAGSDELVVLRGIEFVSLCEHHLLPFTGTADVGYLPPENGTVVGLSKLARLVDCFARRLQLQERMTREIAGSLMSCLNARGAAVVVRASHSCMACRGVKKPTAEMVTSSMLGAFREQPELRAEFLSLCRNG